MILPVSVKKGVNSWCFEEDAAGAAGAFSSTAIWRPLGQALELYCENCRSRWFILEDGRERHRLLALRTACFGPKNHASCKSTCSIFFSHIHQKVHLFLLLPRIRSCVTRREGGESPALEVPWLRAENTKHCLFCLLLVMQALEWGSWRVWTLLESLVFSSSVSSFWKGKRKNGKCFS